MFFFCWKDHLVCRLSCPWHVHVLRLLTTMCALALLLSSLQNLSEHSGAAGKIYFHVSLEKKIRHTWCLSKSTDHVLCLKIYLRNIAFMYRFTSKEFSSRSILISSCPVSNCWNNCVCGSCLKYVGCVHFWERKVMTIVKIMHRIRHLPEFSGMYLQYWQLCRFLRLHFWRNSNDILFDDILFSVYQAVMFCVVVFG